MVVLNLLATGGIGGIEVLNKSISESADWENYIAFVFDGGKLEEEIPSNKKYVLSRGNKNRLSNHIYKQLIQICLVKNVDIVVIHHHNWFLQRIFLKLHKELPHIKIVFMIHHCYDKKLDLGNNPIVAMIRYHYLNLSLKAVDRIFAVSNAGLNSFTSKFNDINQDRCRVVYNGIDQSQIDKGKNNMPLLRDEFHILYIGRLEKIKGLDIVIRALPLIDKNKKVILTIVGAGSYENELKQIAENISTELCRVEFLGAQRDKDVYLKNANVFVYPSICEEIFGISIVEAMAYGLPCVTNRVGGLPEVITDCENGYFTDDKSPQAFANCLKKILMRYEDGSIDFMIKFAKRTATRFSIQNTCEQLQREYAEIVDNERDNVDL